MGCSPPSCVHGERLFCALAPRALPRSRWRGCCSAAQPPPPPLLCSWSPSGHRVNSRGVILGWACGLGQPQDLLLMIFWGSGSWVLSGPPGKLQAYQVRNQINTPGGRSKQNSGFREPPHPARPNCHLSLPWNGGLFFGSQAPRNRTGLQSTQGDADLGDQSVFDNFWTQAGADQPYPSPHAWPQATQCPWVQ